MLAAESEEAGFDREEKSASTCPAAVQSLKKFIKFKFLQISNISLFGYGQNTFLIPIFLSLCPFVSPLGCPPICKDGSLSVSVVV